jgi:hypothetical protein
VRTVEDTAALRITLPAEEGRYEISYGYFQDTVDKNNLVNRHYVRDSAGHALLSTSERVNRGSHRMGYTTKLEAFAEARTLELRLGNYPEKPAKPLHFTVDSLRVVWFPARERARNEFVRMNMPLNLAIDSILAGHDSKNRIERYKADSGSLHLLPPHLPKERDTDAVE